MTSLDPNAHSAGELLKVSYLPSKPIYLSQTTGPDIPQALHVHIWQQALHWERRGIEQASDVLSW